MYVLVCAIIIFQLFWPNGAQTIHVLLCYYIFKHLYNNIIAIFNVIQLRWSLL